MLEKLPKGWVKTTLGEIVEPSRERALPIDAPTLPYVGLEHIEPQSMRLLGHGNAFDIRSSSVRFSKGDVLYGKMRPYLNKIWVAEFDGLCSAELLVFPKRDGLNSQFLAFRLNAEDFVTFANGQVSGERPRVDFEKLSRFLVLLPPLAEQERIAAKLNAAFSAVQRAETAGRRAQERLKRYRTAVLDAAVSGELSRDWREVERTDKKATTETGEALLHRLLAARRARWEETELQRLRSVGRTGDDEWKTRYAEPAKPKNEHLSELPKGWVWASLDQLLLHITDGDHQPPPQSKSGVPFLVIGNISNGRLDFTNTRFVSKAYAKTVDEFRKPARGDILYSLVGSFGIAVRVDTDVEFCIQRHLAVLRPHELSPTNYIHLALNSSSIFLQAAALATGTAQKTVPLAGLRRIAVPLPPLDEQGEVVREVDRRLAAADRLADKLERQLRRASHSCERRSQDA